MKPEIKNQDTQTKNIPASVFKPLADKKWYCQPYHLDKYSIRREFDDQRGITESFTVLGYGTPIQEIVLSGVVHPDFYDLRDEGIIMNQYYIYSLEQFLAYVQLEWDAHQQRMNELLNTPAGRDCRNRSWVSPETGTSMDFIDITPH